MVGPEDAGAGTRGFYTLATAAVTQVARGVHDIGRLGAVESDPPPAM
jgi:hypothetical protein